MLSCVSNGDMRHALDMFRAFLSSGNTDVDKILRITKQHDEYVVPFHEFAKSAILGSRRFYSQRVSHVVNLFGLSEALRPSHFTALRLLARLSTSEMVSSEHGVGYLSSLKILREFRESFGFADDALSWLKELLARNLIESEPPRATPIEDAVAFRITAAGAYYWKYLVRAFSYLDLVFVDTPLGDRELARRLGEFAKFVDLDVRFERVDMFLSYLVKMEAEELKESTGRSGPYGESLMKAISKQISDETRVIRERSRSKGVHQVSTTRPKRKKHRGP